MKRLVQGRIEDRTTLGIMSGTSLDGVDISLVRFRRNYTVREYINGFYRFPSHLRKSLFDISSSDLVRKETMMLADKKLGEFYAKSSLRFLKTHGIDTDSVDLVGCHGQTVFHSAPRPGRKSNVTLQIGMPDIMAQRIGCPVVSDFRTADVAADGMGAPLTPIAHYYLFRDKHKHRLIANIGGISNVTYLPASDTPDKIFATDCGPGNMLIDSVSKILFGIDYDRGGKIASSGNVNKDLERFLKHNQFLRRKPPISLGREQFGPGFIEDLLQYARKRRISDRDILCTVSRFTCLCIQRIVRRLETVDEVLICGGGAKNIFLMDTLRQMLPGVRVSTTNDSGVDPDFVESTAFALLANLAVDRISGNLTGVTGARWNVVLGKITLV